MQDKYTVLKQYYGYDSFRTGQEPVIDNILSGHDVLAVMPTGAGKSICYQIPAIMLSGITLVISPLISLMRDQVSALNQNGIPSAYLNSSLTPRQFSIALSRAINGAYKIIYVAPERLTTESFRYFAQNSEISLIAIDEAHCVSQWGHDFRRSYTEIGGFVDTLPHRPVMAAFTATATEAVKNDIVSLLHLNTPFGITTGFDRPNLYFGVVRDSNRMDYIRDYLSRNVGRSGIIYAMTRKAVEQVYQKLNSEGYQVTMYHAGLPDEERVRNQDDFIKDVKPIMVATNAFGMGIDKPDVGFIIHYNMPMSMEAYYQEAGRAGRDGSEAECILLYSPADIRTAKFLIDNGSDDDTEISEADREEAKRMRLCKLERMVEYCESTNCLRSYILRYFGEQPEKPVCGKCSACGEEYEIRDITAIVRAVYTAVSVTGERYGMGFIVDYLHGNDDERMKRMNFTQTDGFGSLSAIPTNTIRDIITRLIESGLLERINGTYPILTLKPLFDRYIGENRRITMKFRKEVKKQPKRKEKNTLVPETMDFDQTLYEDLRNYRRKMAEVRGIPTYCICTDYSLKQIAMMKPQTKDELSQIRGIGDAILSRYGQDFLKIIRSH